MRGAPEERKADRRRIAKRALELRQQGVTVKMTAIRLGIERPEYVKACITEFRKTLAK